MKTLETRSFAVTPQINLLRFLLQASFVLIAASLHAAERPPNIVLILADDLGYGDCGCYGQKILHTPSIDRLSQQGMRWTQFYAGSTVCAPSRCVLMTGKHTGRCLIRGNSKQSLPYSEVIFPQILREAGYRCGLFGKWGLGQAGSTGTPLKKGFDEFFGYLDQTHAHNFFPTFLDANESRKKLRNLVPNESPMGAGVASEKPDDASELILEQALAFLEKYKSEPFFLFFSINLPHANNEAGNRGTQEFGFGKYSQESWPDAEKGFAHMVEKMDAQVGTLVDRIDSLGIGNSTLILFSSDNGPHQEGGHKDSFFSSSGILRGSKRSLTDGGIRVPTIARWTSKIKPASVSEQIGCFDDLFPTFLDLAGASDALPEDLTGVSLVPTLLGNPDKQKKRDYLYWSFYEGGSGQAVRSGSWKLIEQPLGTGYRLYRIDEDPKEERDLASSETSVLDKMKRHITDAYRPGNPPWILAPSKKNKE
ncbi:MAG: arylsulfatase [Pirellula sp.]